VPVRVVAPTDLLEYRVHCALQRRHLTASQRAALVVALERFSELQAEGRARRGQNLRQCTDPAVLPDRGETRAIAAKWANVSPRTIGDAILAARDEKLFAQVQAGKLAVDVAARRVRRRLRAESAAPPPPLPEGPFDLIYIDAPWQMGHPDSPHAPEAHYETLSTPEIIARVPPAAENAFMAMWAVNSMLPEAFDVIDAWGFAYKSDIIWDKLAIKLGRWARNRHETLLLATRGNFPAPDPEDLPPSVIQAPCGRHSQKPEAFYEILERMYPHASKLEMYARNIRLGWTSWGNEAEGPR
jgi:N6-adenosine-specific RNA methylase IME4